MRKEAKNHLGSLRRAEKKKSTAAAMVISTSITPFSLFSHATITFITSFLFTNN